MSMGFSFTAQLDGFSPLVQFPTFFIAVVRLKVRLRGENNSIYFQILFNHLTLLRMFAVRRVNWGNL